MEHSRDKELAGWLHSKSCSQYLGVQVAATDEWCLQGSPLGLAQCNILVGDMDRGVECSFISKFSDDTKLCGVVDTLEDRDTIQRDRYRLQK